MAPFKSLFEAYSNWERSFTYYAYSIVYTILVFSDLQLSFKRECCRKSLFQKWFPTCYHILGLAKDLFRYGRNTRPILVLESLNLVAGRGDPNYTPGVDFLDYDLGH